MVVAWRWQSRFDNQRRELARIDAKCQAEVRLVGPRDYDAPRRGKLERNSEVVRRIIDVCLVADSYFLPPLDHHVDGWLLKDRRRFGRIRKPIELQLRNRRLVPAIGDGSVVEHRRELAAQVFDARFLMGLVCPRASVACDCLLAA